MSVPDTAGRDPAGEFHRDALPEVPTNLRSGSEVLSSAPKSEPLTAHG
jgi:hypothetical protein